jgi:protein-tyrosine-phosphatase
MDKIMTETRRILFLCTGNYYRSRYAQILFNHHADKAGLPWRADSRALAIERGACNSGPVSKHVIEALSTRGLACESTERMPEGCQPADFEGADLVIALKEAEHRPYMQKKFPEWEDRITYWHVHDVDQATPDEALSLIERRVIELVDDLAQAL